MEETSERARLAVPATDAARLLLGSVLTHDDGGEPVSVRITEVEAYMGDVDPDPTPSADARPGTTPCLGPPDTFTSTSPTACITAPTWCAARKVSATGLLLRAGEIVGGQETARMRRNNPRTDLDLARGPARLAQALGIDRTLDGADAFAAPLHLELPDQPVAASLVSSGPRVGVSGPGGTTEYPWRFWLTTDPTVSKYRPAVARKPRTAAGATAR
ncbi:DNA-3-methyladenine glycosylase [Arthrobacter sp. ATA002]|uniref:DNA-3-methyladenine glycosylase n=1 Tax=Arthrobacter sp. ATA002 TaxID=2991715 RepID=UPI002E313883|nr:DNA-3-methyladenine glycosylase [Arthrobacter sp. ATA002]